MATAIVSIACRHAGLEPVSIVLLWLAVIAFAPLAFLDLRRARHPLALLHRVGHPEPGFPAFGFVADTCVLGARLVDSSPPARVICLALLAAGGVVWVVIVASLARSRAGGDVSSARGEWLLAVVATEGLAVLAGRLAAHGDGAGLRDAGLGLWSLGAAGCLLGFAVLAIRLRRDPLTPAALAPDWWIVMGAPSIVAVAGAGLGHMGAVAAGVMVAWVTATAALFAMTAAEGWRARHLGLPTFAPAWWTAVFPLGMYSTAGQLAGSALRISWLAAFGRVWAILALGAWSLVAAGELHHAFIRGPAADPAG